MNHDILKSVIFDTHDIIRNSEILPRKYEMEKNGNYLLVGLRRSGKTTLLYKRVLDFIAEGVDWEQIIYVNFEDERLNEFTVEDFQDIVEVQSELSDKPGYFFLDEIQNIDGWEKFVRRLADSKRRVFVTGSNATMLSSEMEEKLGGRLLSMTVYPYDFDEYLTANNIPHAPNDLLRTATKGQIARKMDEYYRDGGFPESLLYQNKRTYVDSVYKKTVEGDIIARYNIRNGKAMKLLVKKLAESVCSPVSYTKLYGSVKAVGVNVSKDTIIEYTGYAERSFLIFTLKNSVAKFADRESTPKYYFSDNGLLNLFLVNKESALLENIVAIHLYEKYPDDLYYLQSSTTGIDVDFVLEEHGTAIQVAYSLTDTSREREVGSLVKLAKQNSELTELYIVTKEEKQELEIDGISIHVVPVAEFLLQ